MLAIKQKLILIDYERKHYVLIIQPLFLLNKKKGWILELTLPFTKLKLNTVRIMCDCQSPTGSPSLKLSSVGFLIVATVQSLVQGRTLIPSS
jgi:hypothetical protein